MSFVDRYPHFVYVRLNSNYIYGFFEFDRTDGITGIRQAGIGENRAVSLSRGGKNGGSSGDPSAGEA